jgi:hypothetical protein
MMTKDKNWIQNMHMKKGALTARAKRHGLTVAEEISKSMKSNNEKMKRQARLAKLFMRMRENG